MKTLLYVEDAASPVGTLLRTKIGHEVASGMSYLHSLGPAPIIHGDLKLQNILIADHFNAKVTNTLLLLC